MNLVNKTKIKSVYISNEYSLTKNNSIILIDSQSEINVNIKTLSSIRNLSNLESIKSILDYYPELKILNISGSFNYKELIGTKKSVEYSQYLKEKIKESLNLITSYHTEIFPDRKKCYNNLEPVKLNNKVLELPKYNHSGITGRTSIVKGFNFLTMKKDNRSLLKPTNDKYFLVEIDFKSCEPFFYLKSQNFDISNTNDVYSWIANKYKIKMQSRDKFKRGILSMLYGANEYTISKVMQVELRTVKKIKEELGINSLKERLEKEYNDNGFILNYYGRPITSDNNVVNYWIQSSAVDYCSLAFYHFFKSFNVKPSFFIHDSMTFQIKKEKYSSLKKIKELVEPRSNISIPVEFIVLSE
tara:strand:- start:575 stop:1645 length:1071 start_codon:yes stop_codon:yes gene_type:complete